MVAKPVSKKPARRVAKVVAKPVAVKAAAPVAVKPVVEAPKPAPAVAKAEAPKPVVVAEAPKPAAPAAKPVEAPKPVAEIKPIAPEVPAAAPVAVAAPTVVKPVELAPVIEEGKKAMTETFTKVEETAKKLTADAGARATAMFGDINARTKTAVEKGSKAVEQLVEFSKGNLEALAASGRVAAKGAEEIAKYTAEYGRSTVETANANAKRFAAVKSPTEFFQLQNEVAKTSIDSLVAEASKFSESYLKLLGEIVQPISNRYAVAAEKVKTAVAA